MQRPLATVIVGGMITSTMATLVRLRFDGARDWTDPRFLASRLELEEAGHD